MGDCGGTWRWVDTFTNGNKEQENRNKKWNDRVGAKGTACWPYEHTVQNKWGCGGQHLLPIGALGQRGTSHKKAVELKKEKENEAC